MNTAERKKHLWVFIRMEDTERYCKIVAKWIEK